MRTQVCIIGGGPSGLLLSLLLHRAGIKAIVLEKHSRAHVLSRIRAGVLEEGSANLLRAAGVGARMDAEGHLHSGVYLSANNQGFRIDIRDLTRKSVLIYGQTEVTADLYRAHDDQGFEIIHEVEDVQINEAKSDAPSVSFTQAGKAFRIDCDVVAGCDGYHGVSRASIPKSVLREFVKEYPFGWLGVLSETPPVRNEIIYANHTRGFALCSMRNDTLSRYYVQIPMDQSVADWSDAAFWSELKKRIPSDAGEELVTGPSLEKSVAPLRSYVAEPMQWGRLFLVGDAAHIVPPTGAKGLNLAFGDVHYLYEAVTGFYSGDSDALSSYSQKALARVWKAMRFSWWFTSTMHRFPDQTEFDQRLQDSEIVYLSQSRAAQTAFAEQYVGLPF